MSARILIVEDEEPLALLLRYNLEAAGYTVDSAARGDLIQSQELVFVAFDLSLGHSRRQVGVGALELPLDDALDHGEREALLLERADAPDPQQVLTVVDRDPALSLRRGEKALRLVVADRVDGDVARCGKLLDPISHDSLLYE